VGVHACKFLGIRGCNKHVFSNAMKFLRILRYVSFPDYDQIKGMLSL
jgi:hypothetical protein